MAAIQFEIYKVLGSLTEGGRGMVKQLTCMSWGENAPKFDLRPWNDEYERMGKGVTLSLDEIKALRDILNEADLDAILEESQAEFEESK